MSNQQHNRTYTALLIALAFLYVISILTVMFLAKQPGDGKDPWVFEFVASIEGVILLAIITTLVLRGVAPTAGRIATLALNIILLIALPFGTAVAIYGLLKVDKDTASA